MSDSVFATDKMSATGFRAAMRQLRADRNRLEEVYRARGLPANDARWSPSFRCVALFRLSRYLFVNGRRLAARFVWQINMMLTGADISPICDLGDGLVVIHPVATTLAGSAGRRLTVEGHGGLGGGLALDDIGAGPGLPVLGDDVLLARGASVLGPVSIGSRVRIGPGCTVTRDLPDDTEVKAHDIRVRLRAQAD